MAAYVAFVIQSQSCFVDFHVGAIKFICIWYVYSKSMIVVLVFCPKELYHKRELSILTAYAEKLHLRFFSILFWGIFGVNSLYMYVV